MTESSLSKPSRRADEPSSWPRVLVLNALPGLLTAVHLANLLFFLNSELRFDPGPLLKVALRYALWLGPLSSIALTLVTRGRIGRTRRLLPWVLALLLATVAGLNWYYASRYSFYLPPGINRRMIKAAIWLTASSLICFYTALLHTMNRRPYGRRGRYGLILLALVSILVTVERREAFEPTIPPTPRPSAVELHQQPTLYVVGIDGASLDGVLPLARQGRLPFFSRLLEEGVYARPKSIAPVRLSALWTTLATGRVPYQHGIVSSRVYPADFLSEGALVKLLPTRFNKIFWRNRGSSEQIDLTSRRTLAIWDVLQRLQLNTGVVGWPVTDPVYEAGAFRFSDRYFRGDFRPTMAQPAELAERGVLFQVDPEEVDPVLLQDLDNRAPYPFLQDLAGDIWRESLTTFLLDQRQQARAIFLMLPGLGQVSYRNFGGYEAVQFSGVQKQPYVEASQRLVAYYVYLDRVLANLWQRGSGPRMLAVVSPYGFEASDGWRRLLVQFGGRALEGRSQRAPDGLFMLFGDGVRAGQFLDGVHVVDLMPTMIYSLGYPIARDLDGKVLTAAFSPSFLARHPVTFVPSYETLVTQEEDEIEAQDSDATTAPTE